MRKGYTDSRYGQIHWRMEEPDTPPTRPDLYCLHPAPFSGLAFTTIMPFLARDRRVFAPDYPGYGGSDAFHDQPLIADYALAISDVIGVLSRSGPVDLMGFHTGNLVAADIALLAPEKVRRLAMVDIPAFNAKSRRQNLQSSTKPLAIAAGIDCLDDVWERGMTRRIESQGLERSFEIFAEQLRSGRSINSAFHAAFTYAVEDRLPKLNTPVLIIATQSALLDATRLAGGLIKSSQFHERMDITRAVLDESAETIANDIVKFLDKD